MNDVSQWCLTVPVRKCGFQCVTCRRIENADLDVLVLLRLIQWSIVPTKLRFPPLNIHPVFHISLLKAVASGALSPQSSDGTSSFSTADWWRAAKFSIAGAGSGLCGICSTVWITIRKSIHGSPTPEFLIHLFCLTSTHSTRWKEIGRQGASIDVGVGGGSTIMSVLSGGFCFSPQYQSACCWVVPLATHLSLVVISGFLRQLRPLRMCLCGFATTLVCSIHFWIFAILFVCGHSALAFLCKHFFFLFFVTPCIFDFL